MSKNKEFIIPKSENLDPTKTFDTFIVDQSNENAYNHAYSFAENKLEYNFLVIEGENGLGKTHLLQAIAWKVQELFPNKKVLYLPRFNICSLYRDNFEIDNEKTIKNFIKSYNTFDYVIMPEAFSSFEMQSRSSTIQQLIKSLLDSGKKVVLSCSEYSWPLSNPLHITDSILPPSDLFSEKLLKRKAKTLGLFLLSNSNIFNFLAQHFIHRVWELDEFCQKITNEIHFWSIEKLKREIRRFILDIDEIGEKIEEKIEDEIKNNYYLEGYDEDYYFSDVSVNSYTMLFCKNEDVFFSICDLCKKVFVEFDSGYKKDESSYRKYTDNAFYNDNLRATPLHIHFITYCCNIDDKDTNYHINITIKDEFFNSLKNDNKRWNLFFCLHDTSDKQQQLLNEELEKWKKTIALDKEKS